MPTFRVRAFLALLGFAAFTMLYVSVGIRWHTYRARASLHAKREVEHTFEAARYTQAAHQPDPSPDAPARAVQYRKLAELHQKAALENTRLREFYEQSW